jgi:hypothetical protein
MIFMSTITELRDRRHSSGQPREPELAVAARILAAGG